MSFWKPEERATAEFSECDKFRYWLRVAWPGWNRDALSFFVDQGTYPKLGELVVIGLNPSTADMQRDDQTIRKCVNWAKRHDFSSLLMLNCFAFRATNPKDMKAADNPCGDQSAAKLVELAGHGKVVVAWGRDGKNWGRGRQIVEAFKAAGVPLHCFGVNQDGSPLHPCYARLPEELLPYGEKS